jgi:hypothetical protein
VGNPHWISASTVGETPTVAGFFPHWLFVFWGRKRVTIKVYERGRQLRRAYFDMGKKLTGYIAIFIGIFAVPLWLGWPSVKDCTAAGNNLYSCSAAAWVRGDIRIAGKIMLIITFGLKGA